MAELNPDVIQRIAHYLDWVPLVRLSLTHTGAVRDCFSHRREFHLRRDQFYFVDLVDVGLPRLSGLRKLTVDGSLFTQVLLHKHEDFFTQISNQLESLSLDQCYGMEKETNIDRVTGLLAGCSKLKKLKLFNIDYSLARQIIAPHTSLESLDLHLMKIPRLTPLCMEACQDIIELVASKFVRLKKLRLAGEGNVAWGMDGLASLWRPICGLQHLERFMVGGCFFQFHIVPLEEFQVQSDHDGWRYIQDCCKKLWPSSARLIIKHIQNRGFTFATAWPLEYLFAKRMQEPGIVRLVLASLPPNQFLSIKGIREIMKDDIIFTDALIEAGIDLSVMIQDANGAFLPLLHFLCSPPRKLETIQKLFFSKIKCPDGSEMSPFEWTMKLHPGFRFSDHAPLLFVVARHMWEPEHLKILDLVLAHRDQLNAMAEEPLFVGDINTVNPQGLFLEQTLFAGRASSLILWWMIQNGADPRESFVPLLLNSGPALKELLQRNPTLVIAPLFTDPHRPTFVPDTPENSRKPFSRNFLEPQERVKNRNILEHLLDRGIGESISVVLETIEAHPAELSSVLQLPSVRERLIMFAAEYFVQYQGEDILKDAMHFRRAFQLLSDVEKRQILQHHITDWCESVADAGDDILNDEEPAFVFADPLCLWELESLDSHRKSILIGNTFANDDSSSGSRLNRASFILLQIAAASPVLFAQVLQRWQSLEWDILRCVVDCAKENLELVDSIIEVFNLVFAFHRGILDSAHLDRALSELIRIQSEV